MSENARKPSIRFAGFDDAWEQRKLGEMAVFRRGLTYRPLDVCDNGIRVLRSSNINEHTFLLKDDDVFVQPEAINIGFVKENDILITAANGSSRLVGKHALIKGMPDNTAVHGGFMLLATARTPYFTNALMSSPWYASFINTYVAGGNGAIGNLSKSDLEEQDVYVPKQVEQESIGVFFFGLDNLITLHQRKYDKLVSVKKSMLEKMFPKNGSNIPEIRFAGFTDPWEQRELGELTNITSASRVHKHEWAKFGVPFFRSSDVVAAFNSNANEKAFISEKLYDELIKKSGKVDSGDILVTGGGSIGIPYLVKNNDPIYFKDADLIWIKRSDLFDSSFIFYFLTTPICRRYIGSITHIGTIAHYTIEQVKRTPLLLPGVSEQIRISTFFKQLDNLITLHQRKLEKLRNIKKSMLERMFV